MSRPYHGLLIVETVTVDRQVFTSFLACDCSRKQTRTKFIKGAVVGRQSSDGADEGRLFL
eukprot:scaffold44546_cov46-Cyclotella_meneghiniana.AAC.7